MNSYRVLRNTVATVLAASTMVGPSATGKAESTSETSRKGTVRTVHRLTWVTQVRPRVKAVARTAKGRNKTIAYRLVSRRAWPHSQFRCLDSLWTRESNWNHRAYNRSSGAYGIPQALPAGKMATAGRDWRTNPRTQIKWGLGYIKQRYGSPCQAWNHSMARGWY